MTSFINSCQRVCYLYLLEVHVRRQLSLGVAVANELLAAPAHKGIFTDEVCIFTDLSTSDFLSVALKAEVTAGVGAEDEAELPREFGLSQNYPNPFNPSTTVAFDVPTPASLRLDLINAAGQLVRSIVRGRYVPGRYSVVVNLDDLPSGIYFYRLEAPEFIDVKAMLLLR